MCIINNSKKFIFVHVPKCAGTSVAVYYSNFSTCIDVEIGATTLGELLQKDFTERFGLSKHSTLLELDLALGKSKIDEYVTFGFSRNPYERIKSIFTFLRKWNGWHGHVEMREMTDVNDFIVSKFFDGQGVDRMLMPQVFWLKGVESNSEKVVDLIGRVECLEQSIDKINDKIGLTGACLQIDRFNTSRDFEGGLNLELNDKSLSIINKIYKDDFDLLGYDMSILK